MLELNSLVRGFGVILEPLIFCGFIAEDGIKAFSRIGTGNDKKGKNRKWKIYDLKIWD